MKRALSAACSALIILASCSRPVDPAYRAEIEKEWAADEARLRAEDGWLSVVGLYWLSPGPNGFGSDPANAVILSAPGVPPVAGTLDLGADGAVTLRPAAPSALTIGTQPATERALRTDADGSPDVMRLGRLRFYLLRRGDRTAVRVKDPESPARLAFTGLDHFPIDPAYRVPARFERYPEPKAVSVPSAQGPSQQMLVPGALRFSVAGTDVSLEPFVSSPDDPVLFLVFRDRTSGIDSYGAGRFLSADAPRNDGDRVELDFNLATSPPCAHTPHATCPLPPPGNTLPVRIEAGERLRGGH